jgi:hypothetical protein
LCSSPRREPACLLLKKCDKPQIINWFILWLDRIAIYQRYIPMKRLFLFLLVLNAILTIGVIGCNLMVVYAAKGKMYDDISAIPSNRVGLLLGTSPARITRSTARYRSSWTKRNITSIRLSYSPTNLVFGKTKGFGICRYTISCSCKNHKRNRSSCRSWRCQL